jgi:hypothetical protein
MQHAQAHLVSADQLLRALLLALLLLLQAVFHQW